MLDRFMSTRLMANFNFGGKGQKGKHAFNMLPHIVTVMQGINFLGSSNILIRQLLSAKTRSCLSDYLLII